MLRYKLRTLLLLLAILPPLSAFGWVKYQAWKAEQERLRALRDAYQQQELVGQAEGVGQALLLIADPPQPDSLAR